MANYLYNGVELPELPEWDKTAYPYAVIVPYGGEVGNPNTEYRLYFVDSPFPVGLLNTSQIPSGANRIVYYAFGADAKWAYKESGTANSSMYLTGAIWANTNVQYTINGATTYITASDPIPVGGEPLDPTSMLMGWLVGRQIAGMRGKDPVIPDAPVEPDEPSGEIVGYLYNGVQLPDINEVWTDKETYPYASLYDFGEYGIALYLTSIVPTVDADSTPISNVNYSNYLLADDAWVLMNTETGAVTDIPYKPFWASHDILNPDGSIYLAASDPIPVYA